MATAPTTVRPAAASRRNQSGKALVLILIAVLVVVLIIAGAVVWLLLQKKNSLEGSAAAPAEHAAAAAAPAPAPAAPAVPPTFVPLDPFVVNLQQESGERYLQVIMAARVADPKVADTLKSFMPEVRHRINLRLSGKVPSEINTPQGQEALAEEITVEINRVLSSPQPSGAGALVQAVLFNSFIIQ